MTLLMPGVRHLDQSDAEIHDLEALHGRRRGREESLVGGVDLELAIVGEDGIAALEGRMLHPVSAERCRLRHHAAVRALVRPQKQPRVFQAAGANDEIVGGEGPGILAVRPQFGAGHSSAVAGKLGGIGAEHHGHVPAPVEFVGEFFTEAYGRALDQLHPANIVRDRHIRPEVGKFQDVLDFGQIGLDFGAADWPAGIRRPGLGLEVLAVEHPAPAGPVIGTAAHEAQPGDVEIEIGVADRDAAVEILRIVAELAGAGLQHHNRNAGRAKLPGNRGAGWPGAEYADLGGEVRSAKCLIAVEDQVRSLLLRIQPLTSTIASGSVSGSLRNSDRAGNAISACRIVRRDIFLVKKLMARLSMASIHAWRSLNILARRSQFRAKPSGTLCLSRVSGLAVSKQR